jgi:hypothetical protein
MREPHSLPKNWTLDELRKVPQSRACDGCTACCYIIDVPELGKPYRTHCKHECEAGCALWQWRPGTPKGQPVVCANYQCIWSAGFGEEEDRPDKSRILVDLRIDGPHGLGMYAHGVEEGDDERPEARRAMENIATETGLPVYLSDKYLNTIEVIRGRSSGK